MFPTFYPVVKSPAAWSVFEKWEMCFIAVPSHVSFASVIAERTFRNFHFILAPPAFDVKPLHLKCDCLMLIRFTETRPCEFGTGVRIDGLK